MWGGSFTRQMVSPNIVMKGRVYFGSNSRRDLSIDDNKCISLE